MTAGENALQRYDEHAFDRIAESAFGRTARAGRLEQLTFLRMGDLMFDNWDAFCAFLRRMRGNRSDVEQAQQAQLQQQQAEQRKVLSPLRSSRRQQPGLNSRSAAVAETAAAAAGAPAAAAANVELRGPGQSAEAESAVVVLTPVLTQQGQQALCSEEDLGAVRQKMAQLEAELAALQQREVALAADSEQLWGPSLVTP